MCSCANLSRQETTQRVAANKADNGDTHTLSSEMCRRYVVMVMMVSMTMVAGTIFPGSTAMVFDS